MCLAVAVLFYMIRVQDSLRRSSANWSDIASPRPFAAFCSRLWVFKFKVTPPSTNEETDFAPAASCASGCELLCNDILLSGRYATH